MDFNVKTADGQLKKALEELSEKFGFSISENGIEVLVKESPDEFFVEENNGAAVVSFFKRQQVFVALKRLSDLFDKSGKIEKGYRYAPEINFDDLTYMLDCSRNAVPKIDTVEKLVRQLAVLGYDSFMLYTEDTFVVKNREYFGYLRNPFTKEDIRRIDEYCRLFGIELIPCIQTLAHFNTLTRHYAMDYLFDVNDILMVGEESTYEFIEDLISTCADYFSSRRINIGMDEAYMLGRGRYMDKHGARPRFDIMLEHLKRVNAICGKYGFRPMMWSDMFFSLALNAQYADKLPEEIVDRIPADIDLIYWDYCSSSVKHYDELIKKHLCFKNKIAFAGAAWKWAGYTPDNRYSFACNGAAGKACKMNSIRQYIVTGWGDNGADCSVFASLPALLYCSRIKFDEFEADEAYKTAFYNFSGMPFEEYMTIDLGNRLTDNPDPEERNTANKYLLFNDVLLGTLDTITVDGVGETYAEHSKKLAAAKKTAGEWAYLFDTQYKLCRTLSIKADIGIKLRKAYAASDKEELKKLLKKLRTMYRYIGDFYKALKTQWDKENRPNGFDVQDIRIGALKQRVLVAIEKTEKYLNGEAPSVPELGEKLLCFMGHGEEFEKDFDQCEYRWRRMTSVNVNE